MVTFRPIESGLHNPSSFHLFSFPLIHSNMHYQCQSCYMCFTVREDCEKHMDLKDHRTPSRPGFLQGQAHDGNSQRATPEVSLYAMTGTQLTRALNAYYKHTSIQYNLETGLNESVHSYHSIDVVRDTTGNRAKNYGCAVCERQFSSLLAVNQHMTWRATGLSSHNVHNPLHLALNPWALRPQNSCGLKSRCLLCPTCNMILST